MSNDAKVHGGENGSNCFSSTQWGSLGERKIKIKANTLTCKKWRKKVQTEQKNEKETSENKEL